MQATRTCSIDGCECKHFARGWCNTHYNRWKRRGTTDLPSILTAEERLAAGLERKLSGCLEWTGSTNERGYGTISVDDKITKTHRLAWTIANGLIPDGLHVLHHCDNPPCCETKPTEGFPEGHLFLGTDADNVADMIAKGRKRSRGAARSARFEHGEAG